MTGKGLRNARLLVDDEFQGAGSSQACDNFRVDLIMSVMLASELVCL